MARRVFRFVALDPIVFRRRLLCLCFAVLVLAPATPLSAHPHAWIDLEVTLLFSDDGDVVGLTQTWVFDRAYSAYATEGFDANGDGVLAADELTALREGNLESLADYDYFTRIRQGGADVPIRLADARSSEMRGGRLTMTFTTEPLVALDTTAGTLEYAVYDPTFFVEITHRASGGIVLARAPDDCVTDKETPEPNPQLIAAALALDVDETPESDLGVHFAEWVRITCG